MRRPRFVIVLLSSGVMIAGTNAASGQNYPEKPIRIVTGSAGGGSDFTSRQIAQGISVPLGQPVIVDNRASGIVAGEIVARAPADGYSLTVAGSAFWILQLLRKMPYDALKDFEPVSMLERSPNVLVVYPSLPVKSVKELIALAKARPGGLNYGSGATGAPAHLGGELFKSMAGVSIVNVPYKSTPQIVAALISGEVQMAIIDAGLVAPHLKSGKLIGLAVTSAEPSPLAPGLPAVAVTGLPGYEMVGMTGIFAPAKTPAAIVNRLNQEIVRFMVRPEVKERFLNAGTETIASTPEQLAIAMKADINRMEKVIKDAGIRLD